MNDQRAYGSPAGVSRRNFLRASAALGAFGALAPLVSACSSGNSGGSGGNKTIAVAINGTAPYSKYLCSGVFEAVEGTGYKVVIRPANLDVSTELTNLTTLISQGVAGIVNLPVSVSSSEKGAERAHAVNLPITNALWPGSDAADKDWTAVADLDSVQGGQMIADWLKANAKPGKIVVVQGIVGQGFSELIDKGLDAGLAGTGYDVVVRQQGYFDRTKAIGVVQDALQAHPDISIVVDYAAVMGDGISQFLQQRGLSHVTHVTSDGDDETLTWLKTPYMSAVRYYSAAQTGLLCTRAILNKIRTGKTPFTLPVFQKVVTGETIDATLSQVPMSYPKYYNQISAAGF